MKLSSGVNKLGQRAAPGGFASKSIISQPRLRLAVIGAGALGSEVCLRLMEAVGEDESHRARIGDVYMIDPDRLETRNLSLSRMYHQDDVGQYKADLAAGWMNRSEIWRGHSVREEIADVGWQMLQGCDLLISCVDSALARVEIALVARRLRIPMIDGGVSAEGAPSGRVAWFPAVADAACYLCGIGERRRAEMLAYGLSQTLGCASPMEIDPLSGFPGAAPGIRRTAATMVREVLSFADCGKSVGLEPSLARVQRLTAHDRRGDTWTNETLRLPRSPGCPWHEENPGMLVAVDADHPLREVIPEIAAKAAPWRIQFAWPICLEARCRACGLRQERAERLAKLRCRGLCAGCGLVGRLDALRCLGSLGRGDVESLKTAAQLGLPDGHLYLLRRTLSIVSGEEEEFEARS